MRSANPPDGPRTQRFIHKMVEAAFCAGHANASSEEMASIAMKIARFSAFLHVVLCHESTSNENILSANVVRDWALLRLGANEDQNVRYARTIILQHRAMANRVLSERGIGPSKAHKLD